MHSDAKTAKSIGVEMRPSRKLGLKIILFVWFIFFFCEYCIFYIVEWSCNWPQMESNSAQQSQTFQPVKAMILADTHLLGSKKGHWLDKLRREWQMKRSFQTAMKYFKPEVVFVLGDLFDEGLWCSEDEFKAYVTRFHDIFSVPEETSIYVAVGNHDIGFHYKTSIYLNKRFELAFNSPAVNMISIRGNHFVLINSMALEGDGCSLCHKAEVLLSEIETKLKCSKNNLRCPESVKLKHYSRPILLQHFPLFRSSDKMCDEPDSAPMPLKQQRFHERWDCLSRESSQMLIEKLDFRVAFSGHTHFGCVRWLKNGVPEITVPSFNWRNLNNPSFTLAVFSPGNFTYSRCSLPEETTVYLVYVLGIVIVLCLGIRNTRLLKRIKKC